MSSSKRFSTNILGSRPTMVSSSGANHFAAQNRCKVRRNSSPDRHRVRLVIANTEADDNSRTDVKRQSMIQPRSSLRSLQCLFSGFAEKLTYGVDGESLVD